MGTDGFRIDYRPTIKKVVNDRRASLDEENEILPAVRSLVRENFDRNATVPRVHLPVDGAAIADTPRLTLVVMDPEAAWTSAADEAVRAQIAQWTRAATAGPGGPSAPTAGRKAAPDSRPPAPSGPAADRTIRVHGKIPAETWNRVGTRLLPKLRGNSVRDLQVTVSFELTAGGPGTDALLAELHQILDDLRLGESLGIDAEAAKQ